MHPSIQVSIYPSRYEHIPIIIVSSLCLFQCYLIYFKFYHATKQTQHAPFVLGGPVAELEQQEEN